MDRKDGPNAFDKKIESEKDDYKYMDKPEEEIMSKGNSNSLMASSDVRS